MHAQLGAGSVKSIKETTPGPGLHNRHFKYTTTDGVFFCKVAANPVDNFQAEMASLQVGIAMLYMCVLHSHCQQQCKSEA
jgi:hypothetical protein